MGISKEDLHNMHMKNLEDYGHLQPYQIMGLCIKQEAGGEPLEGRIGVGTVIMNRAEDHYRGKDIVDVVCWPYQFSWTLPRDPIHEESIKIAKDFDKSYRESIPLQQCTDLAKNMIEGKIPRDKDLYKCYEYLNPKTAKEQFEDRLAHGMVVVKIINRHCFLVNKKQ